MTIYIPALLGLFSTTVLSACGNSEDENVGSRAGWPYDNPAAGASGTAGATGASGQVAGGGGLSGGSAGSSGVASGAGGASLGGHGGSPGAGQSGMGAHGGGDSGGAGQSLGGSAGSTVVGGMGGNSGASSGNGGAGGASGTAGSAGQPGVFQFCPLQDEFIPYPVSVNAKGQLANNASDRADMGPDGKKFTFESFAINLDPAILTPKQTRVFFRDNTLNETKWINQAPNLGIDETSTCLAPVFSFDGSAVLFICLEGSKHTRLFLHHLSQQTTVEIKIPTGHQLESPDASTILLPLATGGYSAIYAAFENFATHAKAFKHQIYETLIDSDLNSGEPEMISTRPDGAMPNGWCRTPSRSPDGAYEVFYSNASDLSPDNPPTDGKIHVYLRERANKKVTRITSEGLPMSFLPGEMAFHGDYRIALSNNAEVVAYRYKEDDLIEKNSLAQHSIRLYFRGTGQTLNVNDILGIEKYSYMPSLSADSSAAQGLLLFNQGVGNILGPKDHKVYLLDLKTMAPQIVAEEDFDTKALLNSTAKGLVYTRVEGANKPDSVLAINFCQSAELLCTNTTDNPAIKILDAICNSLYRCIPAMTCESCHDGMLASQQMSDEFGVPAAENSLTWQQVVDGADKGLFKAQPTTLEQCLQDLEKLSCKEILTGYDPFLPQNYENIENFIPEIAGSCPDVFVP